MQNEKEFTLILQSKAFKIPSSFPHLRDVDENIYKQLISINQYEVKSLVSEDVFQSFINHWIKNEMPNIQIDNFEQYNQLSQEFDRMNNLLLLFKKISCKYDLLSLKEENQNLIHEFHFSNYRTNDHQIIDILFDNYLIDIRLSFMLFKREDIWDECVNRDILNVDLLTRKIVTINEITYALKEKSKTAALFQKESAKGDVIIPQSINYYSEEYIITDISEIAFQFSESIETITFSENCKIPFIRKSSFSYCKFKTVRILCPVTICIDAFYHSQIDNIELRNIKSIEKNAFLTSDIETITISSNFNGFEDGWCNGLYTKKFNIIQSDEDLISFYDDKYLIGKSDPKNDIFDVLLFARIDIEEVNIPSFIRIIAPYAFGECYKLKHIVIPSQIIQIGRNAFSCRKLETIEISNDSNLKSIGYEAFKLALIKSLFIPPKLVELEYGWCCVARNLTKVVVSPKNSNFICLNSQFILGKSNSISDEYDVLLFACRNIQKAIIPCFIKTIAPFAFNYCLDLREVEFPHDSKLTRICKYAFSYSSIRKISIPSNVKHIDQGSFCGTKLENIEFKNDSKLYSFTKEVFLFCPITSLLIPKSVKMIEFESLPIDLKIIEIEEISQLRWIINNEFNAPKPLIMIPHE